jgi:hypothetical protein
MSTCKGCGREIVWGEDAAGKKIPLDPRPPIYRVRNMGGELVQVERATVGMYLVTHFATCPKASQFSRKRRQA